MATMTREILRLQAVLARQMATANPLLTRLRADPARILTEAGMTADRWQETLLRCSSRRILMLASRQVGKSLTAAALALREALLRPGSLTLLLSPSLRQASELLKDKVHRLYTDLGRPLAADSESALKLELSSGSRIISLPGTEATIRGYSRVALLVIDEAARVPDELYRAVRPMIAVSGGKLVCLSTAYATQGFFYEDWMHGGPEWTRVMIPAATCKRIGPEFLEEEKRVLGPRIFSREYEGVFCSADDSCFDFDSVKAAMKPGGEPPLF